MSAAALVVTNVRKRFGSHHALDGVSLEIGAGDAVVILGPSGCGKTTLLRLIAGLDVPDSGDIYLSGTHVAGTGRSIVPPHQRGIGFVFQDLALWPHLTVRKNLEFVLVSVKTPRAERTQKVHDVLSLVRIEPLSARYPHELSGGEQQRVALARALVGQAPPAPSRRAALEPRPGIAWHGARRTRPAPARPAGDDGVCDARPGRRRRARG